MGIVDAYGVGFEIWRMMMGYENALGKIMLRSRGGETLRVPVNAVSSSQSQFVVEGGNHQVQG